MSLLLSSADLARYEEVARIMLSPLASPSVADWRRDVNRAVAGLFEADVSVSMMPKGGNLFFSEEQPELAASVESYAKEYTTEGLFVHDAVVDLWNRMRRQAGEDVFTWSMNEQMIGRVGYRMRDSEIVSEVLGSAGIQDFMGFYTRNREGESLLWLLYERRDGIRFGEAGVSLLRTLLPSFKAGIDAFAHLDAQRQALDYSTEGIVVFDMNRRELHRNSAMMAMLEADPEPNRILVEINRMASALHPLAFPGRPHEPTFGAGTRTIETRRAQYEMRGTLLPPGTFGPDGSVMVFVAKKDAAELPGVETLRRRYGLTEREAEVAILLAEGHSNSDIAERLFLSPHTARRHTANIFDKLEVSSRKTLALKFLRE